MTTENRVNQADYPEIGSQKPKETLVFGCGYLGLRVAQKLISAGNRVWGVTRSESKAELLRSEGILPVIADWTDSETLCQLPIVDQILVAVSYDRNSQSNRHQSQVGGLSNLLRQISPTANVCYISTTGVYHQSDGSWVDEESPCEPQQSGGQVHLAAERLLNQTRPNSPSTVLRLSGIYGPGRIPRVADVVAGRPIASPREGFLNLIHVDDAADAVISSWANAKEPLYVVSDDRPVVRGDFYREIAIQFGAADPVFIDPPADAPVRTRSSSNKRVRNARMKRDLLPTLSYPTFMHPDAIVRPAE
jgi:nucleoside-diphosphate-sugar epimerase